jgi:hypothetical protein
MKFAILEDRYEGILLESLRYTLIIGLYKL